MRSTQLLFVSAASVLLLAACSDNADLPASAGYGPKPTLPAEKHALISTVYPAKAASWPAGLAPTPAAGLAVKAFATQLEHPRWLYVLATATPEVFGDPEICDETLESLNPERIAAGDVVASTT